MFDCIPTLEAKLGGLLTPLPAISIVFPEMVWLLPYEKWMPMFWFTSAGAAVELRSAGSRIRLSVIEVFSKASAPPAPLKKPNARSKSRMRRSLKAHSLVSPPSATKTPSRFCAARSPGPWIVAAPGELAVTSTLLMSGRTIE